MPWILPVPSLGSRRLEPLCSTLAGPVEKPMGVVVESFICEIYTPRRFTEFEPEAMMGWAVGFLDDFPKFQG